MKDKMSFSAFELDKTSMPDAKEVTAADYQRL